MQCGSSQRHTNYFKQQLTGLRYWKVFSPETLLFITNDEDFYRLYFFTNNADDFSNLLSICTYPGDVVIDYIAKTFDSSIDAAIIESGFSRIDLFSRMSNYVLPPSPLREDIAFAVAADAEILQVRLHTDLNRYTDHFPTLAMIKQYIANGWVLVNRRENEIQGYIIFQIQGQRVNYNYVSNSSANPMDWLIMQRNFYGILKQQGIRSGVLWVNDTNVRVARMHKKFGWDFDGLKDQFYFYKSDC